MRFTRNQKPLSSALRVVALAMISSFLLTIAISDAPRLHEQIHKVRGAEHDCAVTILAAGGIEFCSSAVIATAPSQSPELYTFMSTPGSRLVSRLDFSLLEHAPPAIS
jgi:hypothetical protein